MSNTSRDETRPLIRVIDDDEDLLDAMDFMLRSEGWDVRTYNGATDFFNHDDVLNPGCVILDYSMPGMDGLEVQKRLREFDYPHPVIFLTAHADVDMAIAAFKRGADDLLRKPVAPAILFAAVAQAVQKDSQPTETQEHFREK